MTYFEEPPGVGETFEPQWNRGGSYRKPYTLYRATFIHTPTFETGIVISPNCLIGVNSEGTIDFVREEASQPAGIDGIRLFKQEYTGPVQNLNHFKYVDYSKDCYKFIVPGFIDTHIHASQYPNIGIGLGCPLLEWLNNYTFKLEKRFSDPKEQMELAKLVYTKVINRTLKAGTTCASYFTTIDTKTSKLFADLLLKYGQRGFVGKVCMDHNEEYPEYQEPKDKSLEAMKDLIGYCDGLTNVKPIITPRFAPVCSSSLLKQLGQLAKDCKIPIQTHISENKDEIKLVEGLFPECDNYASVYKDHGLLGSSTILAHAIHLSEKECTVIKKENCSLSHCPTSNSFISSGEAPIHKYLYENKINVSLGTDLSGGYEQSILGVMKHSIMVSHHLAMKTEKSKDKLSIHDVFYMATRAGAIAVGLKDTLGSFEAGKQFDAQLIDLDAMGANTDVFDWQIPKNNEKDKWLDLISKWIFCGDDRNCVKVWVDGNLVVDKLRLGWVLV